ncbi:carbohydrate ABC transporter permease [Geochorda subterranea]|uniref:Sugar ABC transporter permease n=1 Tax=Geochorda subterranea TaxID=3109564 RepID=A0ABZ1BMS4_9FIRM|nr:sugar ABC transporter permease [Limnochorda sp. LNt]WRP13805.1 sugar ABC transporter permease [Limnochorda sp. LNt]
MSFIRRNLAGWLVMLPGLVLLVFFVWLPLLSNVSLSFYQLQGYTKQSFVGLDNYAQVLRDPQFQRAFLNTGLYVFWSIVVGFPVPIALALLLSEVIHLRTFFRTSLYLPNVVPGLAAALLWKFLYDPDPGGMLNGLLGAVGLPPQPWLSSPTWVIPLIVVALTWKAAGATTLIYLATIQSIDATYYEAARMDGTNVWQRVRYITLPSLAPTVRMLLVLQIISVFQVLYEPLVMTGGGPNNASLSLLQLIYRYVFVRGDVASGAALGVIVAVALLVLTACYWWATKRAGHHG